MSLPTRSLAVLLVLTGCGRDAADGTEPADPTAQDELTDTFADPVDVSDEDAFVAAYSERLCAALEICDEDLFAAEWASRDACEAEMASRADPGEGADEAECVYDSDQAARCIEALDATSQACTEEAFEEMYGLCDATWTCV